MYWHVDKCIISGIFEKHKLLFSFQICIKLEQDFQNVQQDEIDFFIKVGTWLIWLTISDWFLHYITHHWLFCILHVHTKLTINLASAFFVE